MKPYLLADDVIDDIIFFTYVDPSLDSVSVISR